MEHPLRPPRKPAPSGPGTVLKPLHRGADAEGMSRELACPICNADVPMDGDEEPGAEVFCAYCRAPLKLGKAGEDDAELEEDF